MGKSPAKWIKTVLFGKKTPKTNLSKNATAERKVSSDGKGPTGALAADSLAATDVPAQITHESGEHTVIERGTSANLSVDAAQLHGEQDDATGQSNLVNSADIVQLEEAATKAQAAFRGYLARRAFKALKGIIRLQALIRGHLVRRQAVSTLRCMHAIVKFQALVRGRQVRLSDVGCEVIRNLKSGETTESKRMDMIAFVKSGKLSKNSFVIKLVASFPTVMPLSLQYDMVDPNSVWSWLERWSSSRFWEPLTRPKKPINSKRQRRPVNGQISERDSGKLKRASQRVSALNGDSSSLRSSTEHEKPRRTQRKVPAQAEPVQDQPQSELERVKRNLKKVSTMIEEASEKAEAVTEKPSVKRAPNSTAPDVPGQVIDTPSQTISEPVTISEQPEVEQTPKPLELDEAVNTLVGEDLPAVETLSLENGDKVSNSEKLNEELNPKEDQAKENQKTRRRKSLPVKQDYSENVSQNTPTRPSYMQATQSAKAKLRAQSSPKFGEDEGENGFVRRHSLPSSTNAKASLLSPRVQKPLVHANGKGGNKPDKSLLSSRDGNAPGWRR